MAIPLVTDFYNKNAKQLASSYESISFEKVHRSAIPHLPSPPASVLDIGAGSGRDAAWFNNHGYNVTAVEPAKLLLNLAVETHGYDIKWICDSLPRLTQLNNLDDGFDIILLSGVWMHIPLELRKDSLLRIDQLCNNSGVLVLSLRYGNLETDRPMYEVSLTELETLVSETHFQIIYKEASPDRLKRSNVSWETIILKKIKEK